jgi:ABC-type multidrug transport system ATPase subunit
VGKKQILQDVSGSVHSGELLGLIGSSGAGKTTLLNLLGFKINSKASFAGTIRLNGEEIKHKSQISDICAYVRQQDIFHPNLTPREVMKFALDVKSNSSDREKNKKIDAIFETLNLTKCADTVIGDFMNKGLSGGEKRRLSIAMEVMNDPKIIFLDEPTSGLDSFSALLIVSLLKKLAARGCIVVCSLHQPSFEILDLVDRVVVLDSGKTIYIGTNRQIVDHVSKLLPNLTIDTNTNPLDMLMRLVSSKKSGDHQKNIEALLSNTSPGQPAAATRELNTIVDETGADSQLGGKSEAVSAFRIFGLLMRRNYNNVIRSKKLFVVYNVQMFFSCVLALIIYKNLTRDYDDFFKDLVNLRNRIGSFFFITMNVYISSLLNSCFKMEEESQIVYKEISSGLYGSGAYFWSKSLMDLLFLLPPLIPQSFLVIMDDLVSLLLAHER